MTLCLGLRRQLCPENRALQLTRGQKKGFGHLTRGSDIIIWSMYDTAVMGTAMDGKRVIV